MKTFLEASIFTDITKWYSIQEMYDKLKVDPKFYALILRWLKAMEQEGFVVKDDKECYKATKAYACSEADKAWEKWNKFDDTIHYSDIMMDFFKNSRENLHPLLEGTLDPVDLFFPQGKFDVALGAYRENMVSKSMNDATIKAICEIADNFVKTYPNRTMNLLEIGAGVGGISIDLIDALKDYPVNYKFTDISNSFLNEAQIRFKEYPWVSYGLYDINKDYWNQGIAASSFDIILCNNVLHNANNEQHVLEQFKEMETANGYLIILDATGTNYALLTSMEFHNGLNGVEDFRAENNQVFLYKEQWLSVLNRAGSNVINHFPKAGDPLEIIGQTLFITQFVSDRKHIATSEIEEYLKEKLPDYMVPSYIEIMKGFPLTSNGKIDRKILRSRILEDNKKSAVKGEEASTDLEKRVAEIWKNSLKKDVIWREENFYDAGGDSLLVAQIVAKMKEEIEEAKDWEWDKLMVALGEAPTIKGICEKLLSYSADDAQTNGKSDYIVVLKEDNESDLARVIVHDGTGTISPYNDVMPYLKERTGSLFGVICGNTDEYLSYDPDSLIQKLGENYANALIETGKKEFEIIGYCMGGLIALEIAKVLLQSGVKLRQVVSIDTTPSKRMLFNELLMERAFGGIIGADITKVGHTVEDALIKKAIQKFNESKASGFSNEELAALDGELAPVGECYQKMLAYSHEERLEQLYATLTGTNLELIDYQKTRLSALYEIFCHSFKAVIGYKSDLYMGDVKVLSCKNKEAAFLPIEETDNEEFWKSAVLGDISWISIPGIHLTCLTKPYAKDVVQLVVGGGENE